jgi:PAS domain-containing protein
VTKRPPSPSDPAALGARTEQPAGSNLRELIDRGELPPAAIEHVQEIVHDLEVHRVELEMQNRALRETQTELEASVQRYADLYDHLPVGYVTVTAVGQIVHANLVATEVLQCDRARLIGSHFRAFLDPYDDRAARQISTSRCG